MSYLNKSIINELILLTESKDLKKIFNYLNQDFSSTKEKGDVLEHYIKYLYERIGAKVIINGGSGDKGIDLFIYGKDLFNPIKVIQVKNHKKPKNIDDIYYDLNKVKRHLIEYENIFTYFSLNGFVKETEEFIDGRISLESFKDLEKLILMQVKLQYDYFDSTFLYNHNEHTYKKMLNDLKLKNKSLIVQPTGTGKMMLIIKFLIENINKKGLILAPTNIILNQLKKNKIINENNYFMTYSALSRKNLKCFDNLDYIILDEMHRVSADTWFKPIEKLINHSKEVKLLGFTATKDRMDNRVSHLDLFNNIITNEITLEDAFSKKILTFPKYISALYSIEEQVNEVKKAIDNSNVENKQTILHSLEKLSVNWEKEHNIENLLKKYLTELKKENDVKFIAFVKDKEELKKFKFLFMKWLVNIFEDIEIKELYSYQSLVKQKEVISWFENKDKSFNKIKILLSIDMLNEGFHLKNINGLFFLRNTKSNLIFKQQLGRGLSVGSRQTLIFDFVDNFSLLNENKFIDDIQENIKKENVYRSKIGLNEIKTFICENISFIEREYKEALDKLKLSVNNVNYIISKIKEFYKTYNRAPSNRKINVIENEHSYYRWILYQDRNNFVQIEKEEDVKFLKLMRTFNNKNNISKQRMEDIRTFREKYGRNIYYSKKEEYHFDRLLIHWMKNQKRRGYKNVESSEDINLIEATLLSINKNSPTKRRFLELKNFYDKNKRKPSRYSSDEKELKLYYWINSNAINKIRFLDKDEMEFLNKIINIKEERKDIRILLNKVRDFYEEFKDAPRHASKKKERIPKEATLYRWIIRKQDDGYKQIIYEEDIEFLKMLRELQKNKN